MRLAAGGFLMGLLMVATAPPRACADGGMLRFSSVQNGYRVSVFTAPTPFRQGPVDISVLIQDDRTGELIPSAEVIVQMTKPGRPVIAYAATFEAATNKLFRAAQFDLPEAGRWETQVRIESVEGVSTIGGEIEAAGALPRWPELWLWIGWPAIVVALFAIHRGLVQHSVGRCRLKVRGGPVKQPEEHGKASTASAGLHDAR